MCKLWSCYLSLLVIAYEYLDESRSHYSNYYGNDSNNNALLPFFLIHFICCTMTHSKIDHASRTSNRSDYQ